MATTTLRTGVPPGAQPTADALPVVRAAWVAVGVATIASLVGRVLLARTVVSPFMFQDEGGYVGVARLLAGDAPALYGPTYLPGWGLLLAPAAAVLEPAQLQDAAQILNAVAAAAVIPTLYLIGRRIARLSPWVGAAAAITGGTMAASVLQATMLLPEALLVLAVAVTVLAVHRALEVGTTGPAVLAGACAGGAYAVHPRAIVAVLAVLVVAAAAWQRGHLVPRSAAALAGSALVTTVLVQLLHVWATEQLYPSGTEPSLAGGPLGALAEPIGSAVITAGQAWYLIVATVGLVPVGLVVALRWSWMERWSTRGLTGAFVALGVLGSLALGTIGSYEVGTGTDVARADLPVYGRYLEQWVPVLIVLAPALARRWIIPLAVAVAGYTTAVGLALHAVYPSATWEQPVAWHNIASLRVPVDVFGRDHLVETGIAVAVLVLAFTVLASVVRDPRWWLVPLAGVAATNLIAGVSLVHDWAGPSSQAWEQRHRLGPPIAAAGETVWVDLDDDFDIFWAYNVQFWHPDVDIAYFEGDPPPGAVLVLGTETNPPVEGATLLGTERDGDLGLWSVGR